MTTIRRDAMSFEILVVPPRATSLVLGKASQSLAFD